MSSWFTDRDPVTADETGRAHPLLTGRRQLGPAGRGTQDQ